MIYLALVVLGFALLLSPVFRCAVFHPVKTVYNSAVDLYYYIKHHDFDKCGSGVIVAYCGLFGRGKTLSAVHRVMHDYKRYNGKKVWCPRRKKFVTQRVKILSNVKLSIPYEDFVSLEQIVLLTDEKQGVNAYDDLHDTLTVTLCLGDEFSVQLNSRDFKKNIDPLFLNTLLTCRHYHISLLYTAQRFGHVDALLRQVTSYVVDCRKLWRFQAQNFYDAWEMENCQNPTLIKPLRRGCWFVTNADYAAYNTLACVGTLKKSMQKGDMMTEAEILALQMNTPTDMEAVQAPSRKFFRKAKKMKS